MNETDRYEIAGALRFEDSPIGPRAIVSTSACEAEAYLHGAHLTRFRPRAARELLYLSPTAVFAPGQAIRGGVPIIFPWFGNRAGASAHGFARTTRWSLVRTTEDARGVTMVLALDADATSRALGFDEFHVEAEISCGRELEIALTITNLANAPLGCEAALHSYVAVDDVANVEVEGLGGTRYLDKVDGGRRKDGAPARLRISGEVDQIHFDAGRRHVIYARGEPQTLVEQEGASATVVWNPGPSMRLRDVPKDDWRRFVCVEAAAVSDARLTIAPGAAHRLWTRISAA